MKILAVIPTYNNESTISQVVQEVLKTGLDVLVIDDGSTDKTLDELYKISGINIISILENRGKGNALREAFRWAIKNSYTHLISIDADGQHDPAEIPKFTKQMGKNENCLIIGSRDFSSAKIPLASRLGRKCSNLAFRLITNISLTDTQSGFRAYPLEKLSTQHINNKDRYDFEIDMLLKAAMSGIQVKEIRISVYYSEETKKSSNFKPILDSVKIAKPIFFAFLNKVKIKKV
jgi:glycosyltransferase involved in cell wall biosynthesis